MKDIKISSFLGFTDNIKEPRKTKVENTLFHMYSYDGNIYNNVEFLCKKLLQGHTLGKKENVQHYKRNGELSKPKTEYRFYYPEHDRYFELNKTQYDFVLYLIENELNSLEKILARDKEETEKQVLAERLEAERIQKEKEEEERKEKERNDFCKWMYEESENIPQDQKNIVDNIFTSLYGVINASKFNYTLVACINNYDNPLCKREIIDRLHNDNKASIKVFECLTGLILPKTYIDRIEYLKSITSADFKGITEYKPRKKPQKKNDPVLETFYIFCGNGKSGKWEPVQAEPLTKYGHDFFIFKNDNAYNISHAETGCKVTSGKTKTEVMEKLKNLMEGMKDFEGKVSKMKCIEEMQAGKNPRYAA